MHDWRSGNSMIRSYVTEISPTSRNTLILLQLSSIAFVCLYNNPLRLIVTLLVKCHWQNIESIDFTFPCLSDDYLSSITFGVYQRGYRHLTMLTSIWAMETWTLKLTNIRGKILSRHTSARKYCLWMKINQDNLQDPVVGRYCECKAGARTVGWTVHMLRQ